MKYLKNKRWLVGVVAALVVTAGALAYWTGSVNSGSGTATTGSAGPTVNATTVAAPSGLYPGGTAGDVTYQLQNASTEQRAHLSGVTISIASIKDATNTNVVAGCTAADFDLTQPSIPAGGIYIAKNDTVGGPVGKLAMLDRDQNQDACKDVTVNLTVTPVV